MEVLRLLFRALALAALATSMLNGQEAKDVAAPVPPQILTGKTVFISNAGGDALGPDFFSGGPNRAYNQFHAAIKSWGRYEIVSSPAEADLIFEIQYGNPIVYDRNATSFDPHFRLTIFDPKTHVILWSLTEHFQKYTGLRKNRDKHFDETLDKLMDDVKKLAGEPAATSEKK